MALSPKEKQQAYRDRKKLARQSDPIVKQCDRLRRLLTDHPQMVEKFEQWMTYRNDEIRTKVRSNSSSPSAHA